MSQNIENCFETCVLCIPFHLLYLIEKPFPICSAVYTFVVMYSVYDGFFFVRSFVRPHSGCCCSSIHSFAFIFIFVFLKSRVMVFRLSVFCIICFRLHQFALYCLIFIEMLYGMPFNFLIR